MYICTSNSLQPNGLQSTRLLCPGILQARILEWVVISYSSGSSWPRDQTQISDVSCIGKSGSLPLVPPGKPKPLAFLCLCVCVCVLSRFGHVQLFATLWTVACQAPLTVEFSRQEYRSGLPSPSPGDVPKPGIKPVSCNVGGFFTVWATEEAF